MGGRSSASVPKNAQAIEGDDAVDQRRLGETVRLLRQRAGFSIQDVAKRTGLSTGMISQLERALAMPSMRTLRLLSIVIAAPYGIEAERISGPARSPAIVPRPFERRLSKLIAPAPKAAI